MVAEQAPEARLLLGVLALVRRERADRDGEQRREPGEEAQLFPHGELDGQAALQDQPWLGDERTRTF